jgi:iron complex outermembrane receptor protein
MTSRRQATGIFAACIVLLFALECSAQELSLSGTVRDSDGLVPDATVTLRQGNTTPRTATTDGKGAYSFSSLAPGYYEISFAKDGFDTVTRTLTLTPNWTDPVDVTFRVGAVSTSITVTDVGGKGTGSRLDIPDRDLPVMVNSIPQELLRQQGVNDMTRALQNASGVQAQRFYGVYEQYTIRGFNAADVMLVDGMRTEAILNRFNTQLNNVDRIEVLKGPNSVLYGGDAVGGAINILRKKPQGTPSYDFMYRGGRFNTHQVAGGITGPLKGYSLLYRVDASLDYSRGWREAGANRLNVSPSLTWIISDRARITGYQSFNRDDFEGDGGVAVGYTTSPAYEADRRFSLASDFADMRDSQTNILFNFRLTPTWEFRNGFLMRRTGEEYLVTEGIYFDPVANEVPREALYFHHHRRPYVNQAELVGHVKAFNMRHTLLFGYDYRHFSKRTDVTAGDGDGCNCGFYAENIDPISLDTFEETTPPITDFTIVRETFDTNRIHAFFWQDQIDVHPKLKVNIAGRFDDFHRDRHRIFTDDPDTVVGVQTRNESAYTYRAGAVFVPAPEHQIYFNSSSSFTPVIDVPENGEELKPQHGRGFEVGYRTQALNGRIQADFAWYRAELNNLVFTETLTTVTQVGKQTSHGIDIDVNTDLGRGTRLLVNYGYTVPEFADDDGVHIVGNRPRFTQRHAANAWLHKNWNSGIYASLGARYMGPMFTNDDNTVSLGGWTTFGGAFGIRRGLWDWSVNAENLFNRKRYFTGSDYADQVYPGAPINVFTTFRVRFE